MRFRPLAEGVERFPPQELVRELHAVDPGGRVYRGYDAIVAIAARVDRLGWLASAFAWGPVRGIGGRGYRLVAGRRHTCSVGSPPAG